jgi:hypothetical protein
MTIEEHETTATWDYAAGVVRLYTTRESVIRGIEKRLKGLMSECDQWGKWSIEIPMKYVRSPQMITKVK